MRKLPRRLDFPTLQEQWAQAIDPMLTNPALQVSVVHDVKLAAGSNAINHRLGRKLQGWKIVRQNGPATIYDQQDANQMPELTLVLVSDAAVTVSVEVY